jgi:hypothetical protein
MIEKSFGRSGYRLRYLSLAEQSDGYSYMLEIWTDTLSVSLRLTAKETEEFVDDIRKEFYSDKY